MDEGEGAITLEKLWVCSRRRVMRLEEGLTRVVIVRLMVWRGWVSERRDAHFLTDQDASG